MKETGAEAKIVKIRSLGRMRRGREMLWIRFASVEEKLEVMKRKRNLKDRKEWTADDLTEKERRIE